MRPTICLALGGGAARGLAHLGVLRVFEEEGINVDRISGTSLGALVGGLYATRPDAAYWIDEVQAFLRSFRSRKKHLEFLHRVEQPQTNGGIFSDMANLVRKSYFWGVTATKPAFISEADYENFIYPLIPDIRIEETKIPFACVATDIRNGKRVLFREGSLRRAISASCALPGIFPPVHEGDMLLVDGGWVERVPVRCACELNADIIIAIDVSGELGTFEEKSGLDIIMRADAVTRVYLNELLIKRADLVIHPNVGEIHWADFSRPKELIIEGEMAARRMINEVKGLLAREISPQEKFVKQLKVLRNKIFRAVGE